MLFTLALRNQITFLTNFSAYPDVIEKDITKEHEFIVLACDGIWDVINPQQTVNFVRERIGQRRALDKVHFFVSGTEF